MHRFIALTLAVLLTCVASQAVRAADGDSRYANEPAAGTEIVHPGDGAIMVYVPTGWFTMGMDREQADSVAKAMGYRDYEQIAAFEWFPQRKEWVGGYFIDKYEVTNLQWREFAAKSQFKSEFKQAKEPPSDDPASFALYPVVTVLWGEAQQYANWAGKALPTEKQWEKAARGTDARVFPWGNELPTTDLGVFVDLEKDAPTHYQMVGSKPKGVSPYGCMDMAGNVYEWTSEWHEPYMNNPEASKMLSYMGHKNGVLRGGSFYHARHAFIAAKRFGFRPDETYYHAGFRTIWEPPAGYFVSDAFKQAQAQVAGKQQEIDALRKVGAEKPPANF
jgi:formylglycine-generating enzyme required for sulfatase activity